MEQHIEKTIAGQGNLSVFGLKEWFADLTKSSIWVRIYTSLIVPHVDFIPKIKKIIGTLKLPGPIGIAFGHLEGFKLPCFQIYIYASEKGITTIDMKIDEHVLKKSNYVIFSIPYKVDGRDGSEIAAKRRLNRISALVCMHMGLNFLRDIIFDGEVNMHDGKYSSASSPMKMPQICEGPFLHRQNWEDIYEISEKLTHIQPEIRKRVELALEFFDRALREDDGFFYYWTALEILCNGKAQKIRSKLQNCYNLRSLKEVDDQTGFPAIARWRHDFFHKGLHPQVSADVERYLQVMFLDLLRQELHLPLRGHIAGMQQTTGYDLSSIGLADNRTEEQI